MVTKAEQRRLNAQVGSRVADRILEINIERAVAKRLLRDITEQGLTPALMAKARLFLERHPD